MKRKRKEKRRRLKTISLWNYPQAHKALPYLRSVTQSLRDHWLDAQRIRLEVDRLSRREPDDREAIRELSAEIRGTLEGIAMPDDLASVITRRLARLGATVDIPAAGLTQGEQLAFYARSNASR